MNRRLKQLSPLGDDSALTAAAKHVTCSCVNIINAWRGTERPAGGCSVCEGPQGVVVVVVALCWKINSVRNNFVWLVANFFIHSWYEYVCSSAKAQYLLLLLVWVPHGAVEHTQIIQAPEPLMYCLSKLVRYGGVRTAHLGRVSLACELSESSNHISWKPSTTSSCRPTS